MNYADDNTGVTSSISIHPGTWICGCTAIMSYHKASECRCIRCGYKNPAFSEDKKSEGSNEQAG